MRYGTPSKLAVVSLLTVAVIAGGAIDGHSNNPINGHSNNPATHTLSLEQFSEGEIQISLATTDKTAVGIVVRERNQGRNLVAFLVDQEPKGAEKLFGLLSAESIARVGSPNLGDLEISFLINGQPSELQNIELAIIKEDGSIVSAPMDLRGFDGSQIVLEITEEETRETKVYSGCLTYSASSSGCGSFSATCCGSGQVCVDYTNCTITCSGCVS